MALDLQLSPAFLAAALALNLTPGADMLFVTAQSLSGGRGAGLAAALGVGTGAVVHAGLAALGLAVLVAAEPLAFEIIRYAGAAYLIWIAVQMIRTPPQLSGSAAAPRVSLVRAYAQGLTTNLLNPKVFVFVLAFLSSSRTPRWAASARKSLCWG